MVRQNVRAMEREIEQHILTYAREVDYDRIDSTRGMDITIATTARTDDEGRALLAAFGFPFRQENQ